MYICVGCFFVDTQESLINFRMRSGHQVVIVTSGAVGVGCQQMSLEQRPTDMAHLQAMAAIGQVHLMRYYDELFGAVGLVRSLSWYPAYLVAE